MNIRLLSVLCFLSISVAATAVAQERVLHFPPDRSLGQLQLLGEPGVKGGVPGSPSILGEAKGDIIVPADARVGLFVSGTECPDLSPLADLKPGIIDLLSITIKQVRVNAPRPPADPETPGDACLASISKMEGLKSLSLSNVGVTATGLGMLAELTSLENLSIREYLDEATAAQLARIKSLRSLSIEDLTPISCEVIKKVESGNRPFFNSGMPISSEILSKLASLPSLEELRMWCAQPDALASLRQLASLRVLRLQWACGVEGMRQFKDMPALTSLNIADLTDEELAALPAMPFLKSLKIGGDGYKYTARGMANLSKLTSLETLSIRGDYSDSAIAAIQPLPNLKQMELGMFFHGGYADDLSDATLVHLANFPSIETLRFSTIRFNSEGLKSLAKLPNLKELWASNNEALDDNGMAQLGKCRHLEYLNIRAENITDAGLAYLEGLSQLKELELYCRSLSQITNEAIARLQEKIPGLVIE